MSPGLVTAELAVPRSLNTVLKRLDLDDLDDRFTEVPVCGSCRRLFKTEIPRDSCCPVKRVSSSLSRRHCANVSLAIVSAPVQTLSSTSPDFSQPGIEQNLDGRRHRSNTEGTYRDVCDGEVWKTVVGLDGKLFFDDDDAED